MYFILLSGKLHKKKFHPSKLNRLNCSSCDRFILGWPAQAFIAFHSAWALQFDRNYMKSPWYERAKSRETRNKHISLMSPVRYRWLNQFFREVCRKQTKVSGSCRNLLWLLIIFTTLLWLHWCSLVTGADRRREAGRWRTSWNEEKNGPFLMRHAGGSICLLQNVLFSISFRRFCSFSLPFFLIHESTHVTQLYTEMTPTCCRESIHKTVNVLVPWLVML